MSKTLKTIALVAGAVALAATGIGLVVGAAAFTATVGVSAATIAGIASAVSTVASLAAQATMKPPDARGTVSQVMIGKNAPVIYAMGRTYIGGVLIYDKANGEDNRYRTQMFAYTAGGPIDSFEELVADYKVITVPLTGGRIDGAATGYYADFLWANSRLGLLPDTALTKHAAVTSSLKSWNTGNKLSGIACALVTMKFDKDGKRFVSGVPAWGAVAKWVKTYDPRLDTTYPGGAGAHRFDDETTWAWSENPALHAIAYARGRFANGKKTVGVGLAKEAINLAAFVELANVCDANAWVIGGAVYEGPGVSKWDNLKRILQAGASEPVWTGGMLSCTINSPKTALDTVTEADLANAGVEVTAMKSWRERVNTIVPRYRGNLNQKWEYVQGTPVTSSTYVTEDGGNTKTEEVQFDLVQTQLQARRVGAYRLVTGREFGPISITVKPRFMLFKPGEALTLDLPSAGLTSQLAVITARSVNPADGSIQLTLVSETTAKHAFALGQTGGIAPPSAAIVPRDEADDAIFGNLYPYFGPNWVMSDVVTVLRKPADALDGYAQGPEPYYLEIAPDTVVERSALGPVQEAVPNRRYYFSTTAQRGTTLGSGSRLNFGGQWLGSDGVTVVGSFTEGEQQTPSNLTAGALPKEVRWSSVSPVNAYFVRLKIYTPALALSSGTFRVGSPRINRFEYGATRNENRGDWATATEYLVGDIYQWAGASYTVHTLHTSSGASPDFSKSTLLASAGANAKVLILFSDRQTINYGTDGNPSSSQPTVFTITPTALSTGTYTVSMTDAAGAVINANTYLTANSGTFAASGNNITWTGSGTSFTLTSANHDLARGATDGVIVTVAHADGPTDKISVVMVAAGAAGAGAKALGLTRDRSQVTVDGGGSPNPATQTTTFTAQPQNLTTTTLKISMTKQDLVVVNANTYLTTPSVGTFAADGNNITWTGATGTAPTFQMTAANWNTARGTTNGVIVKVEHVADVVSASADVVKASSGGGSGSFDVADGTGTAPTGTANISVTAGTIYFTGNMNYTPAATGAFDFKVELLNAAGTVVHNIVAYSTIAGDPAGTEPISSNYSTGLGAGVYQTWKIRGSAVRVSGTGAGSMDAQGTWTQ